MKTIILTMVFTIGLYASSICEAPKIKDVSKKELYCQERVFNAVQNLVVSILNDTNSNSKTIDIITTRNLDSHKDVAKQMSLCYKECML